ncbi:Prolyl endopeptidase [Paraburkholderia ribeironis]|uniref:Prolyl endopeptidase n=1 Tax=Paraburkholderia ribeironis TaxID=1247936 RepID=A0A1N7RT25_9BURK|nr:prolyl oligopeptidase family serine peptidase [Paraburkholderia ribeironis]SIT38249.1 Prolyl endopeptidase [Paraburkholderia ribeironis]
MFDSQSEIIWSPLHDAVDPYVGLEELGNEAVDSWVRAQTARTMALYGRTAHADALTKRIAEVSMAQDRITACARYGDWGYNMWNDEQHPLGFVRRTPWDAWVGSQPRWETVLDINALDLNQQDGDDTRWVLADFTLIYPTYDRALVRLSPSGSDACIVREFDVEARTFVRNGFQLLEPGHHRVAWIDRDAVYVGWDDSAVNEAPAVTVAGFPRQVRRWGRGTPIADAPIVFECEPGDLSAMAYYDPIHARHRALRSTKFFEAVHYWLDERANEWLHFDVPPDARVFEWNEWLFVIPRTDWNLDPTICRGGSLVVIRREAFLEGDRHFSVLFVPSETEVLSGVQYTKHLLIVTRRSESVARVTLWRSPDSRNGTWEARALSLPDGCEVSMTAVDWTRDDTALIYVDHFLTPPALYLADLACGAAWRPLQRLPARFDTTGLVARRRHATAPDGVQIPYWLIGRESDLQGNPQPCLLYGYGGYEVRVDCPHYLDTMGFSWLEPGGVYAIASIRGGGELGPAWHRAAQREKRQVAFDDFTAVAEALISSGVTTRERLAIRGGSNGGLLTAVCMIQRPELFGAVISEVPVLDMSRFHLLLQGALWVDEFGNPDNPDDYRILMGYSPYQNVKKDTSYPPVLFTSSSTDDRVHPGHARKMVAKMQALGHGEVWYVEHRDGGHGAGVEPEAKARATATIFEFLRAKIGVSLRPVASTCPDSHEQAPSAQT